MMRAVIACGFLLVVASNASAQNARLVGRSTGEHMEWNGRTTRDTSSFTFSGAGDSTISVDFVVEYAGERAFAVNRPSVVDIIVTVAVTMFTSPEPEEKMRGLVYGLADTDAAVEEAERDKVWWRSPYLLAGGAGILIVILNIVFI